MMRRLLVITLCLIPHGVVGGQDLEELDLEAIDGPREGAVNEAGLTVPVVPTPEPLGPGYRERVEAFSDREVVYKLYLPDTVVEDPRASARSTREKREEEEAHPALLKRALTQPAVPLLPPVTATPYRSPRGLPALIVHNPGGNPNILRYRDWADERGVILIGINKVSNSMPQHDKPRYQDKTMRDLEARGVAIHPNLKFTIGMSGGSADGQRMARRQCSKFAGLVLQGAGEPPTGDDCRHLSLAILAGAKDPIYQPPHRIERAAAARERGQQVRLKIYPDLAHDWAPLEDQLAALDWMLAHQMLSHPGLTDEERDGHRRNLLHQVEAVVEADDLSPQRRRAEAEWLLLVEPLWMNPEAENAAVHRDLRICWIRAMVAEADAESDTGERHAMIQDAAGWLAKTPEGAKSSRVSFERLLKQRLQVFREFTPEVEEDWELRARFREIEQAEAEAGLDPQKLQPVVVDYQTLASEGENRWAERARMKVMKLTPLLNSDRNCPRRPGSSHRKWSFTTGAY